MDSNSFASASSSEEATAIRRLGFRKNQSHPSFFFRIWPVLSLILRYLPGDEFLIWNSGLPSFTWNLRSLLLFWSKKIQYLAETEASFIWIFLIFLVERSRGCFLFLLKMRPLMTRTGNFMSFMSYWSNSKKSDGKSSLSAWSELSWLSIMLISLTVWWSQSKWTFLSFTRNDPLLSSTSVSAIAAETKACPGTVDHMVLVGCDLWEIEKHPPSLELQASWKSWPIGKIPVERRAKVGSRSRPPWRKGRDLGGEGNGLLRCLWCFLVILRLSIFGETRESKGIYSVVSAWDLIFLTYSPVFSCLGSESDLGCLLLYASSVYVMNEEEWKKSCFRFWLWISACRRRGWVGRQTVIGQRLILAAASILYGAITGTWTFSLLVFLSLLLLLFIDKTLSRLSPDIWRTYLPWESPLILGQSHDGEINWLCPTESHFI